MGYVLDAATTDEYQYLSCPRCTRITLQVTNAQVLIGFGESGRTQLLRPGSATYPIQDEPYLPSTAGLYRPCDEIRVKSYTAGVPAQVKVIAQ